MECYSPGIERDAVARAGERAREASAGLRADGRAVEYLGAVLVPDDEVVFHAFAAQDGDVVCDVSRQADLRFERIVESVAVLTPGVPDGIHALVAQAGARPDP